MTTLHPPMTPDAVANDENAGPRTHLAFEELRRAIFGEGALDQKTKQLIAVAVAHITRCPLCIDGHTALAARAGATQQEIIESIWVAVEVDAGGTLAHPAQVRHGRDRGGGET